MSDYTAEQCRTGVFFICPDWTLLAQFDHPLNGQHLIGPFLTQQVAIEWHCNNLPQEISDTITEIMEASSPRRNTPDNCGLLADLYIQKIGKDAALDLYREQLISEYCRDPGEFADDAYLFPPLKRFEFLVDPAADPDYLPHGDSCPAD